MSAVAVKGGWVFAGLLGLTACGNASDPRFDRLDPDPVDHGARIAAVLGCTGCHGPALTGRDWSDELGTLWTANLTRSAQVHSADELRAMIVTGRRKDRELWAMPSHLFAGLSRDDLDAVVAFIRSKPATGPVHPAPTFGKQLQAMRAAGKLPSSAEEVAKRAAAPLPMLGEQTARGRYIAQATCAECHGQDLHGGPPPFPGDPVRPDLLEMVPAYDEADFRRLLATGKAAGNREVGLMSEVARGRFSKLTEGEVTALRDYILALAAAPQQGAAGPAPR